MKAIVKKFPQAGLWMEDIPIPNIAKDEVLIKTICTSICGTDIHIYKWDEWAQKTISIPMVIGHEFMGTIAKIGSSVTDLQIGDRVTGEGHITCGNCPSCLKGKRHLCMHTVGLGVQRPGCFAEYFNFPAKNIFKLPKTVSDEIGAIFDPYGNAVHTAMTYNVTSEDLLITGAGPIGIMAGAIARKAGARTVVITDPNPFRLELAHKMGISDTVNSHEQGSLQTAMKRLGIENGFSVCFEMSGHAEAVSQILETAQPGGRIALLGIHPSACSIDIDQIIFKMLELKGIYGRKIFSTWFQMVRLIESGLDLTPIITHRLPADEYEKGFELMREGNCGKVILSWI